MRVVGALYGVTLVLSKEEQDVPKPTMTKATQPTRKTASKPAPSKRAAKRKPTTARNARPAASSTSVEPVRSARAAAARSAGHPSNAEIRSWARQNGLTVSDRGRLPASVVTAYRNAQSV